MLTKTHDSSLMPSRMTPEQLDLLKRTVCRGATNDELQLFLYTCKQTGLDPFLKQIYAIKRGNMMTIQTSIDGLRLTAERTGRYAPGREPIFQHDDQGRVISATAYVNKMTADGKWHEVAATAYFNEFAQSFNGKLTKFWEQMPHTMLAKCAESHALRRAFPLELGALYSSEEMVNGLNKNPQADDFIDAQTLQALEEDQVDIEIPEGMEKEAVEEYLQFLCGHYQQSLPVIKRWINKTPGKFWNTFVTWNAKRLAKLEMPTLETEETDLD